MLFDLYVKYYIYKWKDFNLDNLQFQFTTCFPLLDF